MRARNMAVRVNADEGIDALYREQAPRLWRAVYAYAGAREVADDAVAEAFAQCLRGGKRIREPARWVWRAAFRIAAGELKERGMRTEYRPEPDREADPETGELLSALGRLSPRQRAALVLRYYMGYSTAEIGRVVGSTAATVRVHLSQGRRRLRRILEEEDDA
jgi:RNA polymerase sigma factor (sigma-70 family)